MDYTGIIGSVVEEAIKEYIKNWLENNNFEALVKASAMQEIENLDIYEIVSMLIEDAVADAVRDTLGFMTIEDLD